MLFVTSMKSIASILPKPLILVPLFTTEQKSIDYDGNFYPVGQIVSENNVDECNSGSPVLNKENEIVGLVHSAFDKPKPGTKDEVETRMLSLFITAKEARGMGISPVELKRWCDHKLIHRLFRGYYGLETLSSMSAQVVAMIPQPSAMAGISALVHYGYTNVIENEVWVVTPKGLPPINRPGIHTIRQEEVYFEIGITTINTEWGKIRITDREKTVLDALRGQYLDVEEKLRVLKRWMKDPQKNRKRFSDYRNKLHMTKHSTNEWIMAIEAQS